MAEMIRVALPGDTLRDVVEVSTDDVEALVMDSNFSKRESWRGGEYVDIDSPHTTWDAIRRHGRTCRVFVSWRRF